MLRHALTHSYTSDDNDPGTREFYTVLLDKLDELTVYANETETGLQLEYDEKNETVLLRRVTYWNPLTPNILPKSEIKSILVIGINFHCNLAIIVSFLEWT